MKPTVKNTPGQSTNIALVSPLIVTLPYCQKDVDLTEKLLNWIADLGANVFHSCILVGDIAVPKERRDALKAIAKRAFGYAATLPAQVPAEGFAPNQMFLFTAQQMKMSFKLPWLWLEPDCVPLCSNWLDRLAEEYALCPKRFMGPLITTKEEGLPSVHLTGCSIYPHDAYEIYVNGKFEHLRTDNVAWDIETAEAVVPRAEDTDLIKHIWGEYDLPPTFVEKKLPTETYPKNCLDLSYIPKSAVLFHRNKDESLINVLRKKLAVSDPEPALA